MLCDMNRLFLTPEEKASLEAAHSSCENRKEGDRIKAVLLRSEGWTVPQISQALRLHNTTVIRHINDYKSGKLKNESGGSSSHLTDDQTQTLIAHLEANTYAHNHQIVLYTQYQTINAESIIHFMSNLRSEYGSKPIHLILDRSGYHRAASVAKSAESLNIKLHFLPPYSPNLNPIERLWKVMNEKVRNNRFFKGSKDFKEAIDAFFKVTLPNIGHTLNSRINDTFQMLTA